MIFSKKKIKKNKITIVDDYLPSPFSPWRINEYVNLCQHFEDVEILCDYSTYKGYHKNRNLEKDLKNLISNYPEIEGKINVFKSIKKIKTDLFYCLFYNNMIKYFKQLEGNKTPFVFTLYPGGGFQLNDNIIDKNLKKIFDSKYFKGVIVNQNVTKEYLLSKKLCSDDKIKLISGVPIKLNKKVFTHKSKLDIVKIIFFANKYTIDGKDKGFDVFQKIAYQLLNNELNYEFSVIGNFSKKNIVYPEISEKIKFYGLLNEQDFEDILQQTDIILSPNRPFILGKGAFDGFPLSTCVSAALNGNVVFMTDYFDEAKTIGLINGVHFMKINTNELTIINQIKGLVANKEKFNKIKINGKIKINELYNNINQMETRTSFFKKILDD